MSMTFPQTIDEETIVKNLIIDFNANRFCDGLFQYFQNGFHSDFKKPFYMKYDWILNYRNQSSFNLIKKTEYNK